MKHGKMLAATLAIAGGVTLGLGLGVPSASAQAVVCAPGYHFSAGYGCFPDMVASAPSTNIYVAPAPAPVPGPSMNYALGYHNGIDGGDHQRGSFDR